MDTPALMNFPLPMLTALLCGVLAALVWRLELGPVRANVLFSAFFGLGAVEALFVALRFGYEIAALIPLQRTLPLFLAPLIYLGFVSLTLDARTFRRTALMHLTAPVVVMALFWLSGQNLRLLDWVISLSYAWYSVALYLLWRKGPDALVYARVGITASLSNWMVRGLGFIVFILLLDTAIAIDFEINAGAHVGQLISYGTVPLILLLLGALAALPMMLRPPRAAEQKATAADAQDDDIATRLEALMVEQELFRDPGLTVQRLAKRLHLPVRSVSAAVNRTRGMNMSQYVNGFRLAYAARLLIETEESVVSIAAQSGFMTRSNFYREFQRVHRQSPTEYRIYGGQVDQDAGSSRIGIPPSRPSD